jgi:hypothetical protein
VCYARYQSIGFFVGEKQGSTLTIRVNVADVGSPTTPTNAQAEADNVPLEIDDVCCYNFRRK